MSPLHVRQFLRDPPLPRLLLVEAEYEIARLTAERDWVAGLIADLDSGRLDWPADLRDLEVPPVT